MYQLLIRILAKGDIQEIVTYYDEISPTVADRFLENLYADFEVIKNNPFLFQKKYRDTRVRYLKVFPFGIHYIVKGKIIEILAILHTGRNPEVWKKR